MPRHDYGEEDLKAAGDFRDIIHEEALEIVRKSYPEADKVFDRYPVEAYFEDVWEYPGKWYYYVAVPQGAGGRESLIHTIVRDTKGILSEWNETSVVRPASQALTNSGLVK